MSRTHPSRFRVMLRSLAVRQPLLIGGLVACVIAVGFTVSSVDAATTRTSSSPNVGAAIAALRVYREQAARLATADAKQISSTDSQRLTALFDLIRPHERSLLSAYIAARTRFATAGCDVRPLTAVCATDDSLITQITDYAASIPHASNDSEAAIADTAKKFFASIDAASRAHAQTITQMGAFAITQCPSDAAFWDCVSEQAKKGRALVAQFEKEERADLGRGMQLVTLQQQLTTHQVTLTHQRAMCTHDCVALDMSVAQVADFIRQASQAIVGIAEGRVDAAAEMKDAYALATRFDAIKSRYGRSQTALIACDKKGSTCTRESQLAETALADLITVMNEVGQGFEQAQAAGEQLSLQIARQRTSSSCGTTSPTSIYGLTSREACTLRAALTTNVMADRKAQLVYFATAFKARAAEAVTLQRAREVAAIVATFEAELESAYGEAAIFDAGWDTRKQAFESTQNQLQAVERTLAQCLSYATANGQCDLDAQKWDTAYQAYAKAFADLEGYQKQKTAERDTDLKNMQSLLQPATAAKLGGDLLRANIFDVFSAFHPLVLRSSVASSQLLTSIQVGRDNYNSAVESFESAERVFLTSIDRVDLDTPRGDVPHIRANIDHAWSSMLEAKGTMVDRGQVLQGLFNQFDVSLGQSFQVWQGSVENEWATVSGLYNTNQDLLDQIAGGNQSAMGNALQRANAATTAYQAARSGLAAPKKQYAQMLQQKTGQLIPGAPSLSNTPVASTSSGISGFIGDMFGSTGVTGGANTFVDSTARVVGDAGVGAALGAGVSALTGGKAGKGAMIGALTGGGISALNQVLGGQESLTGSAVNGIASLFGSSPKNTVPNDVRSAMGTSVMTSVNRFQQPNTYTAYTDAARANVQMATTNRAAVNGCGGDLLGGILGGISVGGSINRGASNYQLSLGSCTGSAVLDGPGAMAGLQTFKNTYKGNKYGSAIGMITGWTNFALPFVSVIAIAALVYAGFLYLTAAADEGNVDKAKTIVKTVVIGIIIIFSAYAIVNTVLSGTAG